MTDNIKNFSNLKDKFKSDSSYKNTIPEEVDFNKASMSFDEVIAEPDVENKLIISPILEYQGLMQIFGERGIGKSYFTFSLAYALASGGNFLKFKVPVPQKIAYFDGEMGHKKIKPYLLQAQKNQGESFFKENFTIVSCSRFAGGAHPDLENYTHEIYKFLIDGGYNGLIIDNIATCTGIDENDPRSWRPFQKFLIKLRNAGIFVIFVAHAGRKEKTHARGISHGEDVLNTIICLQRSQDILDDREKINVSFSKHRDFSFEHARPFNAIHHRDGSWEVEEINQSTYQQVVNWFRLGASGVKIAEKLDISPQMVSKYKIKATEEGLLVASHTGRILNLF